MKNGECKFKMHSALWRYSSTRGIKIKPHHTTQLGAIKVKSQNQSVKYYDLLANLKKILGTGSSSSSKTNLRAGARSSQ